MSESESPSTTAARHVHFSPPQPLKAATIPMQVPRNPTNGAVDATDARMNRPRFIAASASAARLILRSTASIGELLTVLIDRHLEARLGSHISGARDQPEHCAAMARGRMRLMTGKVSVVIEQDEHGCYAWCPELKGCQSQGKTVEETLANIREAIDLFLETLTDEERSAALSREILTTAVEVHG
jgi:predicted RNase H-like HicB family nuclease